VATKTAGLWVEDSGMTVSCERVVLVPRIGIECASERAKKYGDSGWNRHIT